MRAKEPKRDDIYELISYNVRKYRKLKNLTQAQLAEKTRYSHEFIRRIEAPKNKKYFSIDTINNIAEALEIDVQALFDKRDES